MGAAYQASRNLSYQLSRVSISSDGPETLGVTVTLIDLMRFADLS